MIGDKIEVSVLAIMGEKVRIGIEAPREVPVFREEVYAEIQQDRKGGGAQREGGGARPEGGGARPEGAGARPEGAGAHRCAS